MTRCVRHHHWLWDGRAGWHCGRCGANGQLGLSGRIEPTERSALRVLALLALGAAALVLAAWGWR